QTIQAEDYSNMQGVQLENTADAGGGQNVGWIDAGDWMAYNSINIPSSGSYLIEYRVASPNGSQLSLDLNAGTVQLGAVDIPATGGWQNWTTVSHTVNLNAGTYNFGVYAQRGGWNFNWWRITSASANARTAATAESTREPALGGSMGIYPNPASSSISLTAAAHFKGGTYKIINEIGQEIHHGTHTSDNIDVSGLKPGLFVLILMKDGQKKSLRFIKR
ncbi:MAG: carbohydrate-binding protein, partial [Bacteroidetes bacterium]|nr:carbohydrate-binding protein [Bacteroidota bacterium]